MQQHARWLIITDLTDLIINQNMKSIKALLWYETINTHSCMEQGSMALVGPLLVTWIHCTPLWRLCGCFCVSYTTAMANTLTTQYMVRFSHLTVQLPAKCWKRGIESKTPIYMGSKKKEVEKLIWKQKLNKKFKVFKVLKCKSLFKSLNFKVF